MYSEGPSTETLVDELLDGTDEARYEASRTLARHCIDNEWWYEDGLTPEQAEQFHPLLEVSDPIVRRHVAAVCVRTVRAHVNKEDGPLALNVHAPLVGQLVGLATSDDWRLRQTAVSPRFVDSLGRALAERDADGVSRRHEQIAEALVGCLVDPIDVVRKRAGESLAGGQYSPPFGHAAGLIVAHPSPEEAVSTLVDALSDPVDETVCMGERARSPRQTSASVLAALGDERSEWLTPHLDSLGDALDTVEPAVCVELLDALSSGLGRASVETIAQFARGISTVVDDPSATADERSRALTHAHRSVELAPETNERAIDTVTAGLGDPREAVRNEAAIAAINLASVALKSVPEPFETLRTNRESSVSDTDAADPLVTLADSHPSFVADRLDHVVDFLFRKRPPTFVEWGLGPTFEAVAERSPAAVEPALSPLLEYCTATNPAVSQGACWAFGMALFGAPTLGPTHLPKLVEGPAGVPPLRSGVSLAVEAAASEAPAVAAQCVDALVDTLCTPVSTTRGNHLERSQAARLHAARALAALSASSATGTPEWAAVFVEPWQSGAFERNDHGIRTTNGFDPLLVLGAGAPPVAAEVLARLFEHVGADNPIGDAADFRVPFGVTPVETSGPATEAFVLLFEHADEEIRRRAIREVVVASKNNPELLTWVAEPLAGLLSVEDSETTETVLDLVRFVARQREQVDTVAPIVTPILEFSRELAQRETTTERRDLAIYASRALRAIREQDSSLIDEALSESGFESVDFPSQVRRVLDER